MEYVLKRLVSNLRCNRCNSPVLLSELETYPYQCLACDEDMYGIEVHESTEEVTEEELNYLAVCARSEGLC